MRESIVTKDLENASDRDAGRKDIKEEEWQT